MVTRPRHHDTQVPDVDLRVAKWSRTRYRDFALDCS
jgi:hypothetical protein